VEEADYKNTLAGNIVFYRKSLGWKQSELAQKLNYSDKAVSKWERGEAVPDVVVLNKMARLFGITLDQLCLQRAPEAVTRGRLLDRSFALLKNRLVITLISVGLVWFVATLVVVFGKMFWPASGYFWMAFIYAIPLTAVVLLIFNGVWGKRLYSFIIVSILMWSVALCFFLTIPIRGSAYIFWLALPAQIIIILWSFLTSKKGKE